jgi:hypothetical protein
MRAVALMLFAGFWCNAVVAGDAVDRKVRVALALAQAATVQASTTPAASPCLTDREEALRLALHRKQALVVWIGMKCADRPALHSALAGSVHLHQDSWLGDSSKGILVQPAVGNKAWRWSEAQTADPAVAAQIAAAVKDCCQEK